MITYYYWSTVSKVWRVAYSTSLSLTEITKGVSEQRWMVPGTFDCDGNSTL